MRLNLYKQFYRCSLGFIFATTLPEFFVCLCPKVQTRAYNCMIKIFVCWLEWNQSEAVELDELLFSSGASAPVHNSNAFCAAVSCEWPEETEGSGAEMVENRNTSKVLLLILNMFRWHVYILFYIFYILVIFFLFKYNFKDCAHGF